MLRAPVQKPHPLATGAAVFGALLFVATLVLAPAAPAHAQGTPTVASPPAKPVSKPASSPVAAIKAVKEPTKPTWAELNPAQQQALKPLAAGWNSLSEAQKRKWLALSRNYPGLPPAEQATLHSRMTEWVGLSPQQRTQARLNFAETKKLSPDDKKAKWQAYQALPPEEKNKLAAGAQAKPPATAAALKPVAPQKLATIPKTTPEQKVPRIAAAPHQVDHHTLLPQSPQAPATVPVQNN